MSLWRQFARGLRALTQSKRVDDELDEEVRDFYARAEADLIRDGLSADEAARVARRALGDPSRAREDLAAYGWENAVEATVADVRYAVRRLRRSPSFALTAILTLALGIGASTAIFSAVVPILFEPLPYPDSERIVMLTDRTDSGASQDTTYGTYVELAARSRVFEALAVADRWRPALVGAAESERLSGDRVTADYFRVLGIEPEIGRNFEPDDEAVGGPQRVLISDALAKRRFGGAEAILGRTIRLDGVPHTVIGVLPAGFENVLVSEADVWAILQFRAQAPFDSGEWGHHQRMIGRLRPGQSVADAARDIAAIAGNPVEAYPRPEWASLRNGLGVASLQSAVTAGARPALLAIAGAVVLLLGLACANVTNLLLARGVARQDELAIRAALGAGRRRLARQLLTESLLLAFIGGALGLALARVGVRLIVALAPAGLPRAGAIGLEPPAFLFAFMITTLIGLAVGLAPALSGARRDPGRGLHSGLRATGGAPHILRRGLVVAEVALALVLLTGAGLLLRSVDRLLTTEPGFDASGLLTMQVVTTGSGFRSDAETLQFFQSALEAVRGLPGVTGAAVATQLPLSGDFDTYGVRFESEGEAAAAQSQGALRYVVTPEWFRAMGIPLLEGRLLGPQDRAGAPEAVILSESFAKRRFGDSSPIGKRLRLGPEILESDRSWDVVVGVVGDVKQVSLGLGPANAFYVAMGQWPWVDRVQSLVVRSESDPASLVAPVKQAIWSVNATPVFSRIATMNDLVMASESERRFVLRVLGIFASAAVLMAGLGLYGVIAGSVAERTREIGLRNALGAGRAQILALVMRQGLTLAAAGVALGLAGAVAASRGLESLLYSVTFLDPMTYGGVVVLLAAVSALASLLPAWRAAKVDPTMALRSE